MLWIILNGLGEVLGLYPEWWLPIRHGGAYSGYVERKMRNTEICGLTRRC